MLTELIEDFPLSDHVKRISNGTSNKAQPFLQWVGGKREFLANYKHFLPTTYNSFHEPFVGGGAVFFDLCPDNGYISDLNEELIVTYRAVRDYPEEIIDILQKLRGRHSKELYYAVRALDRESGWASVSIAEVAARMIYLNQTGFNGLYRVNRKGQYNVPIGSSLNRLICDPVNIRLASVFLKKATIEHRGYQDVLNKAIKGDFVYLDPPYAPAGDFSDFVRYTKEQFSIDDQIEVAEVFKKLDGMGVKVALANADVEIIRELYKDYTILPVLSSRNLSSKTSSRIKAKEVLVVNYSTEEK